MSELFGLSADIAVKTSFSFDYFSGESKVDEASWGVGFYRTGDLEQPYAAIIKEPISARYSLFNYFLKYGYIKTNIFISNIRYASVGAKVHLNTHPFEMMLDPDPESYNEKSWVFTHNGTMPQIRNDSTFLTSLKPHGNTDSEYVFCYFIDQLRRAYIRSGNNLDRGQKVQLIQDTADRISRAYPKNLNFIMSDGFRIYAYYNGYELAGGLWYLSTTVSQEKMAMIDTGDGMTVTLSCDDGDGKICLISANPLSPTGSGEWRPFPIEQLKVFENGEIIH